MRDPVDPQDPAIGDESRPHRRVDGLRADEVPDRRKLQLVQERFLRDDVAFVELPYLDFELALAERLADQVRICRRDQGLFPLVVHLHADRHRWAAATTARRAYTCFSRGCRSVLPGPSASATSRPSRA